MEDYLDEQEQWRQVVTWLRESGPWMLGAIIVVLLAYGGWNYWQGRVNRTDLAAEGRYEAMLTALDRGQLALGSTLADALAHDYPGTPYADQAELAAARISVQNNQLSDAAAHLTRVLTGTHDPQLRVLARLRLARVQIAQGKPDEALRTLNDPTVKPGAFAARYAEVRGDALLAKGDRAGALQAYLAARAGADTVDAQLLDLKIDDLAHS